MEQGLDMNPKVVRSDGRPVLQPTRDRVPILERRAPFKKAFSKSPNSLGPSSNSNTKTSPLSPKLKSPRPPAVKRSTDPNGLNSSTEKFLIPCNTAKQATSIKKSKNVSHGGVSTANCVLKYPSSFIEDAPGSRAAARREQVAIMRVQRKIKIARYGRTKSSKYEGKEVPFDSLVPSDASAPPEEKRCSFIPQNSDPIHVAYHDETWGVPIHDDKLSLELLVLTVAQVGSDWTSVTIKKQSIGDRFSDQNFRKNRH